MYHCLNWHYLATYNVQLEKVELPGASSLHKHNLKEHGGLQKDITTESAVKKEPAESLTIKEEPIDCNDCGICDSCITIHGVAMSIDY